MFRIVAEGKETQKLMNITEPFLTCHKQKTKTEKAINLSPGENRPRKISRSQDHQDQEKRKNQKKNKQTLDSIQISVAFLVLRRLSTRKQVNCFEKYNTLCFHSHDFFLQCLMRFLSY